MKRIPITPRPDWQRKVESVGLTFHTLETGQPYWDESACYVFSLAEIDQKIIAQLTTFREMNRRPFEPPTTIVDPTLILHEMRVLKTPEEIEIMQRAADIAAHPADWHMLQQLWLADLPAGRREALARRLSR